MLCPKGFQPGNTTKIRNACNSLKRNRTRTQQYLPAARTERQIQSNPEKQDFQEHNPHKHRPYNIPAN